MKREDAIRYIGYCVDDALGERHISEMPDNARLIGWQCGFEPMFVAVWSYLSDTKLDDADAETIAVDLLKERKWFTDGPRPPDYIM
jgi:hypothetical protein